jgi:alpha-L-rhamnosidase
MADLMAKIAGLTGRSSDSVMYSGIADSVRVSFNSRLYNPSANKYGSGKQITYIMPLLTGIIPVNDRPRVFDNLLRNVSWECDGHFGSGIYGTSFLPDILCDNGKPDAALALFTQTTYPGFGYQIKYYDATTTWEQWEIIKSGR